MKQIVMRVGELDVEVTWKRVKHLRLRVLPPPVPLRVSAPLRTTQRTIRQFVESKMAWIQEVQKELQVRERVPLIGFESGEEHLLWGEAYPLRVVTAARRESVALQEGEIVMCVKPGSDIAQRGAMLDAWYAAQLKDAAAVWQAQWEQRMGVSVRRITIRRMATCWGSCTPARGSIRLNLELARVPRACAEYVVVHELVHLLEVSHNARFKALMTLFMPDWRIWRQALRGVAVRHPTWEC